MKFLQVSLDFSLIAPTAAESFGFETIIAFIPAVLVGAGKTKLPSSNTIRFATSSSATFIPEEHRSPEMLLSEQIKVADIVSCSPVTASVFHRYQIDFCGGSVSLQAASEAKGHSCTAPLNKIQQT